MEDCARKRKKTGNDIRDDWIWQDFYTFALLYIDHALLYIDRMTSVFRCLSLNCLICSKFVAATVLYIRVYHICRPGRY